VKKQKDGVGLQLVRRILTEARSRKKQVHQPKTKTVVCWGEMRFFFKYPQKGFYFVISSENIGSEDFFFIDVNI
jgi:hypothetical protein